MIKVEGSAVICLTSLTFTTNKGRVATFGVRRGRYFSDTGGSDKHLVTVNGMHAPGLCVRGIGFKWGNINANGNDHYNNKEDKADNKDADNKDADNKDDGDEDDDGGCDHALALHWLANHRKRNCDSGRQFPLQRKQLALWGRRRYNKTASVYREEARALQTPPTLISPRVPMFLKTEPKQL